MLSLVESSRFSSAFMLMKNIYICSSKTPPTMLTHMRTRTHGSILVFGRHNILNNVPGSKQITEANEFERVRKFEMNELSAAAHTKQHTERRRADLLFAAHTRNRCAIVRRGLLPLLAACDESNYIASGRAERRVARRF